IDRDYLDRCSLRHGDDEIDCVLFCVQLDVHAGHPRIGEAAVGIKRLYPLAVGVEPPAVEGALLAPGQLGALPRGERRLQPGLVNRFDTDEDQFVDNDSALFLTRGADSCPENDGQTHKKPAHRAWQTITRASSGYSWVAPVIRA